MAEKSQCKTIFIVENEQGDHTRRPTVNLIDQKTNSFIETLIKNSLFFENKNDYALFYNDTHISIRVPDSTVPLEYFSHIIFPLLSEFAYNPQTIPHLSLISQKSHSCGQFRITFKDQYQQYPDLSCELPIVIFPGKSLAEGFMHACANKTWDSIIHQFANSIKINPSLLILRHLYKNSNDIIFPFTPIASIFQNIFQTDKYQVDHQFLYSIATERVEISGTRLHSSRTSFIDNDVLRSTFFRSLLPEMVDRIYALQDDIFYTFLKSDFVGFLPKLLSRIYAEFVTTSTKLTVDPLMISAMKHILSSSLVSVFMPFASSYVQRCDFKLRSWNVFVSWVTSLKNPSIFDFNFEMEKDGLALNDQRATVSTLTGINIVSQPEFVEKCVDCVNNFFFYFHNSGNGYSPVGFIPKADTKQIFGSVLVTCSVSIENDNLTLILTRGFLYICDLTKMTVESGKPTSPKEQQQQQQTQQQQAQQQQQIQQTQQTQQQTQSQTQPQTQPQQTQQAQQQTQQSQQQGGYFPHFQEFPQKVKLELPANVVCALPLSQWEFMPIPNGPVGAFSSPSKLLKVKFTSADANRDILTFWIMFSLAKLEIDKNVIDLPFLTNNNNSSLANDECQCNRYDNSIVEDLTASTTNSISHNANAQIHISYPYLPFKENYIVSSTVSVLNLSWDSSFQMMKVMEIVEKVRMKKTMFVYPSIRKMAIPVSYTGETQIQICNNSIEAKVLNNAIQFNSTSNFLQENDSSIEDHILKRHTVNSSIFDMLFSCDPEITFEILMLFKLSDFTHSLFIGSQELLNFQLENFHISLSQFTVNNIPLLHFAALTVDNSMFVHSIAKRNNVSMQENEGMTALFYALRNPNLAICQALIDEKIDLDACNIYGISPLIFCIEHNDFKRAEFLLKNGAAVNRSMQTIAYLYKSALFFAIQQHNREAVLLLLNYCGENINAPSYDGSFVTHQCIEYNFTEILKDIQILTPQFDPNLSSDAYPHPLHFFIEMADIKDNEKNVAVMKDLLGIAKIDVNYFDKDNNSPLYSAIDKLNGSLARELIKDKRCDVDQLNAKGETPLFAAVVRNKTKIARKLIEAGAIVNMPNIDGMTPLYKAVETKNPIMTQILLDAGALPNQWYVNGKFPLNIASGEIEKKLVEKGANNRIPTFSVILPDQITKS